MKQIIYIGSVFGLMVGLWGAGCGPTEPTTVPSENTPKIEQKSDLTQDQPQTTRSLNDNSHMRVATLTEVDFPTQFPTLSALIAADGPLHERLTAYAQQVLNPAGLTAEAGLLAVFDERDQHIIPRLSDYVQATASDDIEKLEQELNQLGLQLVVAEGTVIGVGGADMLQAQIRAFPAVEAYMDFRTAQAQAASGEYPFLDMSPYQDMILAGEKLNQANRPALFARIKADFDQALINFTDIHLVQRANTRTAPAPVVGGTHTESYPYETELSTHKAFVAAHPESRYQSVVQKILRNPSEISEKPEQLYVIVNEWVSTEDAARQRVQSHLQAGEDIPHFLPIKRPNGKTDYAVTYRFYEDEDKALTAFEIAEQSYPSVDLVYCSIKGETLYQLGPAEN